MNKTRKVEILLQAKTKKGFRTIHAGQDIAGFTQGAYLIMHDQGRKMKAPGKNLWRLALRYYEVSKGKRRTVYRICGEMSVDLFMSGAMIRAVISGTDKPPKIGK